MKWLASLILTFLSAQAFAMTPLETGAVAIGVGAASVKTQIGDWMTEYVERDFYTNDLYETMARTVMGVEVGGSKDCSLELLRIDDEKKEYALTLSAQKTGVRVNLQNSVLTPSGLSIERTAKLTDRGVQIDSVRTFTINGKDFERTASMTLIRDRDGAITEAWGRNERGEELTCKF